jgi:hypothetical protein
MPLVFTYGPDAVVGRMSDRIVGTRFIGTALLLEHRLVFDKPNVKKKGEGLPNLKAEKGAKVFGLVFEVPAQHSELLDGFYGGYGRKAVKISMKDCTAAEALETNDRRDETWAGRKCRSASVHRRARRNRGAGMKELIVKFVRGVSEDDARSVAEDAGAKVRRRMRADSEDEVMLLLKIDGDVNKVKAALDRRDDVEHTEINEGGFGIQ